MEANEITETIAVGKKKSPLDVSSRIISGIFTPFMIPFVAFFLLFFFTYIRIMPIPVSYTHLDVYKRQVYKVCLCAKQTVISTTIKQV